MEHLTAEDLFARHHRDVFRYLARMTGRVDVAEDLAQDVFVRVVQAVRNGGPVGHERGWVFSIARNLLVDRYRDGRREATVAASEEPVGHGTDGLALDLARSLERLPQADRDMFLLKEIAGLSYQEIADTCQCTVDAVRARLHRARLSLRRMLSL